MSYFYATVRNTTYLALARLTWAKKPKFSLFRRTAGVDFSEDSENLTFSVWELPQNTIKRNF